MTTPETEEPEAGILEVGRKVATTAKIDSFAKKLVQHFQYYVQVTIIDEFSSAFVDKEIGKSTCDDVITPACVNIVESNAIPPFLQLGDNPRLQIDDIGYKDRQLHSVISVPLIRYASMADIVADKG